MSKIIAEIEGKESDEDFFWIQSRKQFIRNILLAGVASQLTIINACSEIAVENNDDFKNIGPLNKEQFITLRIILDHLFPEEGDGPGALQFNADKYLIWVLNDPLIDPKENLFIIENIDRFTKYSYKKFKIPFLELNNKEKITFIHDLSSEKWCERWYSRLITLIFEALLLDPIYGSNTDNIGWEWLNHDPGYPRPIKKFTYPQIFSSFNDL